MGGGGDMGLWLQSENKADKAHFTFLDKHTPRHDVRKRYRFVLGKIQIIKNKYSDMNQTCAVLKPIFNLIHRPSYCTIHSLVEEMPCHCDCADQTFIMENLFCSVDKPTSQI